MERLLKTLKIEVNERLYVKNPESSDLGRRILSHGIAMIYELGFEHFTFRKLGERIESNESSIYRYFENKHKFLLYLTSRYWGWVEYRMVLATFSLPSAEEKLFRAIEILTGPVAQDQGFGHIDERLLNGVVVNEYSKSYLTKEVDQENKEGYFAPYKRLVQRVKELIVEVDPKYPFPSSLASTVLEGALHQHFLMDHFPAMTDCKTEHGPTSYFLDLVRKSLDLRAHG